MVVFLIHRDGWHLLGCPRGCTIINTLIKLGHPQPTSGTPNETDYSTAHDILTSQVHMKSSKAFDMWYHWIKDIIVHGQYQASPTGSPSADVPPFTFRWPAMFLTCKGVSVHKYIHVHQTTIPCNHTPGQLQARN